MSAFRRRECSRGLATKNLAHFDARLERTSTVILKKRGPPDVMADIRRIPGSDLTDVPDGRLAEMIQVWVCTRPSVHRAP